MTVEGIDWDEFEEPKFWFKTWFISRSRKHPIYFRWIK